MALKDWKLESKRRWHIVYHDARSINRKLVISYQNLTKYWEVFDGKYIKSYYFKSKSQALAFAKSYMRTH